MMVVSLAQGQAQRHEGSQPAQVTFLRCHLRGKPSCTAAVLPRTAWRLAALQRLWSSLQVPHGVSGSLTQPPSNIDSVLQRAPRHCKRCRAACGQQADAVVTSRQAQLRPDARCFLASRGRRAAEYPARAQPAPSSTVRRCAPEQHCAPAALCHPQQRSLRPRNQRRSRLVRDPPLRQAPLAVLTAASLGSGTAPRPPPA